MSGNGKQLFAFLRRCAAVSRLTLPAVTGTRPGGSATGLVSVRHRTWIPVDRSPVDRTLCQPQAAFRGIQSGFCTKAGAPCEDDYPPLPEYPADSQAKAREVYLVQVKGLPWSCTVQDLLQFFSECRIRDGEKGVHLTLDRQGRPSGRAFIEMEHEDDVNKALEKHRQYLGPRYVEVFEVTDGDAESILQKSSPPPPPDGVVLLRGLPFSCSQGDIHTFFSGLQIAENGITMVRDAKGRISGEAFVRFCSPQDAAEALKRDRDLIGHRYTRFFPAGRRIFGPARGGGGTPPPGPPQTDRTTRPGQSPVGAQHYVHMRGIPFQASGEDVVKFFSPLPVARILLECGPDGRPSGGADVFFSCHGDATAAMSRDRGNIGERYIELFLNSVAD
ncbi:LOW QUALITY PROTEIN: G-rich sequence factor 1 [Menidia menidia]